MARVVEIIPALMPEGPAEVVNVAKAIESYVDTLQLDIMDGSFVKDATWPYSNNDPLDPHSLPDIKLELDLMIKNPGEIIGRIGKLPVSRVILHWKTIGNVRDATALFKLVKAQGRETLLAFTLADEWRSVLPEASQFLDGVQIMGIGIIGVQGMPFDTRVLPIIKEISTDYPKLHISIDGGMKPDTAREVARAGATRIVSGSYVVGKLQEVEERIGELRKAAVQYP